MNHQEDLTMYTSAFVDELSRANIKHAVISPGSRSTPISMLLAKHPDIEVHINIDERSAAFFALGIAKSTKEPVAVVCTSGTAAANYYPAIVEAHYSRVPLVIITADRPHELRDIGAPQAIDQIHLYGQHVKWFCEMSVPESKDVSIQYVRNVGRRAAMISSSHPAGPVHLNFPIREPLIPNMEKDYFQVGRGKVSFKDCFKDGTKLLHEEDIEVLLEQLRDKKKGLIICGEISEDGFAEAVIELADKLQYPILADPLSQLRKGRYQEQVMDCYDTFLRFDQAVQELQPDVIIRFGAMPVSKALTLFIKQCKEIPQIVVDGGSGWREPTGLATEMIYGNETALCVSLSQKISHSSSNEWHNKWQQINQCTKQVLQSIKSLNSINEGQVFTELSHLLPQNSNLFISNSMPIRDCDTFFHCNETNVTLYANRGANGIDGVVSTALGVSVEGSPTVLVIGDLSFFHDLNGLLAAKMLERDITIIIINNDGGGIFSFLPQSSEKEHFEQLFGTPHGLDFSHAVEMYGGKFTRVEDWEHFKKSFVESFSLNGIKVIELVTEREKNVLDHRNLWNHVSQEINCLLTGKDNENTK
ncbi:MULTISPECIES: 2-succinyl-5-enolpyruvyl-6-hydroxy-3-cyclohexene-1-carboxylic-acid synthase [Bacillus]|uniref:2-succinyl-5-enolpyruvyl-6-hydroxy-3- cyclohexene-1-carboxylic-acid synthase n=1 Tax=Bacillus TaxID=1386 RepID=UPI0002FE149A|nr:MULTISPECIES: 2-succinyl-5-enolpyruvyl-6-hydroxy-3-cyclohexene-1-carboxylic-acid synthase [Bacillus]